MPYVDGFLLAVPKDKIEQYKKAVDVSAPIFKEYGAIDYVECVGDDVPYGELTSFPRAVQATDDERRHILLDNLSIARGARCRQCQDHEGRAHDGSNEGRACRRKAHDLRRLHPLQGVVKPKRHRGLEHLELSRDCKRSKPQVLSHFVAENRCELSCNSSPGPRQPSFASGAAPAY